MLRFDHYIAGGPVPPSGGAYFGTEDPFTGETWAEVARGNTDDVDAAVRAAHAALTSGPWPQMTATQRGALLRKLGDLVLREVEMLALAESADNGKTLSEMRGQMKNMAEWYYFYAGLADKVNGEVIPTERRNHLNYTRYEPLGVVAMIIPWNSPLRLLSWKLAPALAAGNTAVIKPSEFTSTSAIRFMSLIEEAGFPPGVVNVVTGFGHEVKSLVTHPLVARVAFTGGEEGGMAIAAAAGGELKPVSLELGGKSPNIVFEDAHLENAARGVTAAIFASCGQSCVAGSRLLVHESIKDRLLTRVIELARAIRMGDPRAPGTEMGPIANRQQYDRILARIEAAKREGARLALGGRPADRPECGKGLFIEPTIFDGVTSDMRIARDEVFGPVLAVLTFRSEDEAVTTANDTPYGLAAGIWTQNLTRAHRVAARIEAGSIWINTYRISSQLSPFGGYKRSGIGREGGIEMIKSYLQTKSVWIDLNEEFPYPFALPQQQDA